MTAESPITERRSVEPTIFVFEPTSVSVNSDFSMTEPRPTTVRDWSVWDNVAHNIYDAYEGYRAMDAASNAASSTRPANESARPDWWQSDAAH